MKGIKYLYAITNRTGVNLWSSLPEDIFHKFYVNELKYKTEEFRTGHDLRDIFVADYFHLIQEYQNMEDIEKICGSEEPEQYFLTHEIPGEDEDMRDRIADRILRDDYDTGMMFNHIDKNDDVDVAVNLGLVKYPPFNKDTGEYEEGIGRCIPADVANTIKSLLDTAIKMNKEQPDKARDVREQAKKLEHKAVDAMILISGFDCDIHGGDAKYEKPLGKDEIIKCPQCGHPVCPVCANCYSKDPDTMEEARKYMESCDSNAGMAYCGYCGDYSPKFMLGFLKLTGYPIPPEYENFTPVRRENAQFLATATVNALPDFEDIFINVKDEWDKGYTGIIKVQHPTGEIWGWTDKYPDRWVVTIMYQDER